MTSTPFEIRFDKIEGKMFERVIKQSIAHWNSFIICYNDEQKILHTRFSTKGWKQRRADAIEFSHSFVFKCFFYYLCQVHIVLYIKIKIQLRVHIKTKQTLIDLNSKSQGAAVYSDCRQIGLIFGFDAFHVNNNNAIWAMGMYGAKNIDQK